VAFLIRWFRLASFGFFLMDPPLNPGASLNVLPMVKALAASWPLRSAERL
jgi:hypothetical protein